MAPTLNAASESWNEGEKEATPYPSPNALAHVVLRTTPDRYEEMIDFYVRLLKATVTCRGPVITFLRYDYEHHRIAIVSAPEVVRGQEGAVRAGLDHVSFAYKTLTDLARTYVGLRSLENPIKPIWTVNHGPTTSLYYRDPDRNKIELQVDNFDRPEDANEFMGGQYYESNPIGSDFDVDEWAKYILEKAKPDGSEGLTQVEEKALKKRIEVGDRRQLPEVYF